MNSNNTAMIASAVGVGAILLVVMWQERGKQKQAPKSVSPETQRKLTTDLYVWKHSTNTGVVIGAGYPPKYSGDPKVGCCPPGTFPGARGSGVTKQIGCWRTKGIPQWTPTQALNYAPGCSYGYFDAKSLLPAQQ